MQGFFFCWADGGRTARRKIFGEGGGAGGRELLKLVQFNVVVRAIQSARINPREHVRAVTHLASGVASQLAGHQTHRRAGMTQLIWTAMADT